MASVQNWMEQQKDDGVHGKCMFALSDNDIAPFTHEMFCDHISSNILSILSKAGWVVADENVFREEVGYTIHETSTWMGSPMKTMPTYVSLPSLEKELLATSLKKTSLDAQKLKSCWLTKKKHSSVK